MGARLCTPANAPDDHDIDDLDPYCDHLLVRAADGSGTVVATCRILTADGARAAGGWYTDRGFDLGPVRGMLASALEVGRVCIDPGWRNGLLVLAIWRELGERMAQRRLDTMIGCCSVGVGDGGRLASRLWIDLQSRCGVAAALRVRPWTTLELLPDSAAAPAPVPALFKGYLRCGGKLLGPPALDADFNTADFPMLMHLSDLPQRYGQRIFGGPLRR
jgi:putative hemolysin